MWLKRPHIFLDTFQVKFYWTKSINYKKIRQGKISDKYFDQNVFDEMSNEMKFNHDEIFLL